MFHDDSPQRQEVKSVLEHVKELRKKIFIALGAFVIGASVGHVFHKEIIAFLLRSAGEQQLIFLSPLEPLFFIFKIDCLTGLIISFPIIVWCLFSYITPALPRRIASSLFLILSASALLLASGLLYAFLVTIPLSLEFLFSIVVPGIQNQISAQSYIDFFIAQALIITLVFQSPVLIIGGIYLGAFSAKNLASKRDYIYLAIVIALAVLTPTTDIFSLAVILIPCLAIFEVSLIGGRIVEALKRKKNKNNEISSINQ